MAIRKTGDWQLAIRTTLGAVGQFEKAADKVLKREAVRVANDMRKAVRSGIPPPQSKLTRATGGKGKPLNRGGDLAASIDSIEAGRLAYFIGVPRSAGSYNLAMIHENGATIVQELTDAKRALLHAKLRKVGPPPNRKTGVMVIVIPKRSFIEPAFEKAKQEMPRRYAAEFAAALGGRYGRV